MAEYDIQPSPSLRTSKSVFSGGVEGEWTPTVNFDVALGDFSATFSVRRGHYIRIGSIVWCFFSVIANPITFTTSSGSLMLDGLPFSVFGAPDFPFSGGNLRWGGINKANYTDMFVQVAPTFVNSCSFLMSGNGVNSLAVQATNLTSGGTLLLVGHISYQCRDDA